jgi:WD40 repeat protein
VLTFEAHKGTICGLAFSSDGRMVATGAREEPVRWWNLNDPTEVGQFTADELPDFDPVLLASPDGRFLACGGADLIVWEIRSGARVLAVTGDQDIAFSPDSTEIAVAHARTVVKRWSLPKGEPLRGWSASNTQHRGEWTPTGALVYSPDGKDIATACAGYGSESGSGLLLWNRKTGKPRRALAADFWTGPASVIRFSPDGTLLAGAYGPTLGVVNVETGAPVVALTPGKKYFTGFCFAPDGKRLIAVNNDAVARAYDTTTWAELSGYEWQIGRLTAVAIAPDGLRAACGSSKGRVVVWDLEM